MLLDLDNLNFLLKNSYDKVNPLIDVYFPFFGNRMNACSCIAKFRVLFGYQLRRLAHEH